MVELAGEQVFLLLNRSSDLRGHEVRVVSTYDDALEQWDWTTRSSPIFPLEGARFPVVEEGKSWFIVFIGPVDPGTLNLDGLTCFLSYGIHNLIAVSDNPADSALARLLDHAKASGIPWEGWQVIGSRIGHVEFSPAQISKQPLGIVVPKLPVASQLRSASEEYRTLIAVTRAKCARYLPEMEADIASFDEAFQRVLDATQSHSVAKLAWLANVNAALSRFSSQTFAGTSPILETECHFWTHSLLGIGTATQALVNIRRQYDFALDASRLAEKIDRLASVSCDDTTLTTAGFASDKCKVHWLEKVVLAPRAAPQKYSKLIAYFSGRDGYRSTSFTLSAPLELISSCNMYAWTPLTLTHELSHTLTSTLLRPLLEGVNTDEGAKRLAALVTPAKNFAPRTALDQAQKQLITAYMWLEFERDDKARHGATIDSTKVLELVERYHGEMVELITHLLDFQYFYGRNVELYMTSIWESWDVIPNIQSRIDEYLVRSLVAVLSSHQRGIDFLDVTYDVVLAQLASLNSNSADSQYLKFAYERLRDHKEFFKRKMYWRVPIVKLVLGFFYDPETRSAIAREIPTSKRRAKPLKENRLDEWQVTNPLDFLVTFARDRAPKPRKALWMLHKLAFSEKP
ncbi:hypothetical protein VOM14_18645 [Paraburkholderia sp. MPAMCS5]|uniref:hypothetical protein n=1 Tax=Paraburkholderia sp. MPAMCS5 TaxID=3112563 RepID=UPI002E185AF6|nr:hypothetical protein [Paraburkholderia sp. MPAMCS5]